MDDGVSATESRDMDQRPEDEDLQGLVAPSVADGGALAVDQWPRAAEANPGRVRAQEEEALQSLLRCQGRVRLRFAGYSMLHDPL